MNLFIRKNYIATGIIVLVWLLFFIIYFGAHSFINGVLENRDGAYGEIPGFEVLENPPSEYTSHIYSEDNVLLGTYFRNNRTPVEYKDLSRNVVNALIATEDVRFKEHSGIDLKGLMAIPFNLLRGQRRGASTISQQLAKNLFNMRRDKKYEGTWLLEGGKKRMVAIKAKEWITAVRLETAYTKEEILAMYLNTVDFGANSFGIQVASKTFFGVSQDQLTIEQAAVLIGMLKGPSLYSPVNNPENAINRRNTVLRQLKKYSYINPDKCDSLISLPIELSYKVENHNQGVAPYFRKVVKNYLVYWCKENGYDLFADGLKIYTTLNHTMQTYAEEAVREHMTEYQAKFFKHWEGSNPWTTRNPRTKRYDEIPGFLENKLRRTPAYKSLYKQFNGDKEKLNKALNEKKPMRVFSWEGEIDTTMSLVDSLSYYLHFLHTGFMAMNPKSGEIKAWVGGVDHKYFKYDHVKQGKRQPGSTFKPIVYATILGESGVATPCYEVVDAPVSFETGDPENPTWTPSNADGKFSGETMTLRQAMAQSKNSITAYMMKKMGDQTPQMVLNYARNLGITSHLEAVPAMCLGTFDVSLYEMVGAYSTFMNDGVYTKPFFIDRIEDRFGNIIFEFPKERKYVLNKELAYTMQHMLKGATQERGGTGMKLAGREYNLLQKGNEIGGKTGTTQDYSDGWFMGVTPELVAGAWVGADDRRIHFKTLALGQGGRMALPIYAKFMKKVYADESLGIKFQPFPKPKDINLPSFDCSQQESVSDSTEQSQSDTFIDVDYSDEDEE